MIFHLETDGTLHEFVPVFRLPPGPGHLERVSSGKTKKVRSRMATEGLTWVEADRFAVSIGKHPCEVWPDWVDWHLADIT